MQGNELTVISYSQDNKAQNSIESVIYLLLILAMSVPSVMSFARFDTYSVRGLWALPAIILMAMTIARRNVKLYELILSDILLVRSYAFIPVTLFRYLTETVGIVIESPVLIITPSLMISFLFAFIFMFARNAEWVLKNT